MLQWTRITKVTLNVQMISEYTSLFQYPIELMKYEIAYVETHFFIIFGHNVTIVIK